MSAIDLEALKVQATRAHRMTCSDPDDPTRETPYSVQLKLIAALEAVESLRNEWFRVLESPEHLVPLEDVIDAITEATK